MSYSRCSTLDLLRKGDIDVQEAEERYDRKRNKIAAQKTPRKELKAKSAAVLRRIVKELTALFSCNSGVGSSTTLFLKNNPDDVVNEVRRQLASVGLKTKYEYIPANLTSEAAHQGLNVFKMKFPKTWLAGALSSQLGTDIIKEPRRRLSSKQEFAIALFAGKALCFFLKCKQCQQHKAWWLNCRSKKLNLSSEEVLATFPAQKPDAAVEEEALLADFCVFCGRESCSHRFRERPAPVEKCLSCAETIAWLEGRLDQINNRENKNAYNYGNQTPQWGAYQRGYHQRVLRDDRLALPEDIGIPRSAN